MLKQAVVGFAHDDMPTYAAALAFRALLALFPFAIFLLAMVGALGQPSFFDWLIAQARTALPADAARLVTQVIGQIRGQASRGLLSFGIVAALWAASSAVRAAMPAYNAAYHVAESRPTWRRYVLSLVATIGLAVLLIVAAGLMLIGPRAATWLAGHVGLSADVVVLWTWLRWPVAAVLLLVALAVVNKVAPNVAAPIRLVTPGSILALVAWLAASLGFAWYVGHVGSYGATYGSLAGVVVLLLYFWLAAAALLLGAELNGVHFRAGQDVPARAEPG